MENLLEVNQDVVVDRIIERLSTPGQLVDKLWERLLEKVKVMDLHIMNGEEFMTIKQTHTLLGISRASLIHYTKKGAFKAYKIEKRVLYNKAEVMAAMDTYRVKV